MSVLHVTDKSTITNEQLIHAYELLKRHNDIQNANKIIDLYEKIEKDEFIISFTGHFSAGKSSLLNYFIGKEILPNSPIPTSANIVKITSGEGVVKVFFKHERPVEYEEPYDIDLIKDYCMNKDQIERIEISTSERIVPENSAFLDTPGIDAADDADREMTESSLHTVDVLFYVMDYNHVQSEVNLYFLQDIQKQQIPFYIIINQIDKHNENEIPFSQFDAHVKETFVQWNVTPEAIYYTSIFDQNNELNELESLKTYIFDLFTSQNKRKLRIQAAFDKIISDHKLFLKDEFENELQVITDEDTEQLSIEDIRLQKEQLEEKLQLPEMFRENFEHEVNDTLNNAYLMPAQLRDLAANFLEAEQKGFKVGFFNAKKKTEAERNSRLEAFLKELQKTIENTIQWNLREKLLELVSKYDVNDEQITASIQSLAVTYRNVDVRAFINRGATFNGTYVLNYTNEVSNDIKSKFRQQTRLILESINEKLTKRVEKESESFNLEAKMLELRLQEAEKAATITKNYHEKRKKLESLVERERADERVKTEIEAIIVERSQTLRETVPVTLQEEKEQEIVPIDDIEFVEKRTQHHSVTSIVQTIDRVLETITGLEGFESLLQQLAEKRERLENRELTIALFGAFSAGKSSFSNALLGEKVLPVSPNPTTAVISNIRPVTEHNPHGTVRISLKDDATLLADIASIVKDINDTKTTLDDTVRWLETDKVYKNELIPNVYQAYLRAILVGYDECKNELGTAIEISLADFPQFVTDETKACFIEAVDLYYDCALTQKGITLVDTPGADSVNARHTNVAFDYIKDADAIIYVTYYNHAITSADRDFLMQLGRVKESFELDKMFFIVNASDLAKNDQELQLVLNYVNDELISFGIRKAKIFPLSSKRSLEEKLNKCESNDEMKSFEREFYRFVEDELATLTIQAAEWDIKRIKTTLKQMLDSMKLDEKERTKRIERLQRNMQLIESHIEEKSAAPLLQRLQERIERQLHFVLERLYIRFHDMFTEHFNPTTITESGRNATIQLEKNRNQFVDYVGYELLQEVRAVTLRIEAYMKEYVREFYDDIQKEMTDIDESLIIPSFDVNEFDSPEYEQAFTDIDLELFSKALRSFKNLRSFFELNEREKMKDLFYETMKPIAEKYIEEQQQIMLEAYNSQLNEAITEAKNTILRELLHMIGQQLAVLKDLTKIEVIENKYAQLAQIDAHE